MSDVTLFGNYLEEPGNIDVTCEFLLSYSINKFFSVTFQSYLIYDHDINIPRYNSDLTPVYLERPAGQVDPLIGGNHYFVEYNQYYANPAHHGGEGVVIPILTSRLTELAVGFWASFIKIFTQQ